MELKTQWFVVGLLSFTLGSIFLAGYFLTPGYKSKHANQDDNQDVNTDIININFYSDKHYALPFGISLMSFGFLVVLVFFCR